jgi:hypothetical protein
MCTMSTTSPREHAGDPDPSEVAHAGLRLLRRHHEGTLGYFERRSSVKFILEPSTGKIIMPIEPGFAKAGAGESVQMVLMAPSEQDFDIQVSLMPIIIERPESEEGVDRWAGYHGKVSETNWVRSSIEGGKADIGVFDPEQLETPNPLGRDEYALIRQVNADRERLARACKAHAGTLVADPLCVGVDPLGFDVRARFGIVRVEFPVGIYASTKDAAAAQIDRILIAGTASAE